MKVLVVDDEMLARENIKVLLKEVEGITDIIEADNGLKAIDTAWAEKPDLIFLDIQMPGESGINVVEQLPEHSVVIFATAYDKYAVKAFELNAIDYLLKPFDDNRFFDAVARAREKVQTNHYTDYDSLTDLVKHLNDDKPVSYRSRLVVKDPGRIRLISVGDVNFIKGAGNYVELHLFEGSVILHRETLTSLEEGLDPGVFIRIHRSTIIRRDSVVELRPNDKGDYIIYLKTGEQLTMSRRHKAKLEELLN